MIRNRLLFVCPTCSPFGGLQTWLDEVAQGLTTLGWEPIVALVHGPTTNDSDLYRKSHPNLNTLVVDGSGMTMGARVRLVQKTIRRLKPEYYIPLTVIDAHDAICALKQQSSVAPKYVLTVHGNLPQQIADVKLFQPFADVSINPGRLTCELVKQSGMPVERITHIPNGTQLYPIKTPSPPDQPLRLAYVGRLTASDKRVLDLIPLVAQLEKSAANYHLDIVGSGPAESQLRDALRSPRVRFHGFVPPEQLHRDFYPNLDVLLMFSQSEAFGISLIEAMSHGVLPVSSRFVGSRGEGFLIDHVTARLFDIGDAVHCSAIVCQLHENRSVLQAMSLNAHALISQRYEWSRCIERWHQALESARNFSPRSTPLTLPRKLDEGNSLAARFPWLPPVLSDTFYRFKFKWRGLPEAMKRGEEWPLHTREATADQLAQIAKLTEEIDKQCAA
jgi:glycosyltransferase involved in cell wall biosynthesis